ncbi:MAG: hotdog fold thioesterase [Alphaproteobacteria bacterium]|nr:hotdog fold thioesterase [Alphaproteobacteria bacterium]
MSIFFRPYTLETLNNERNANMAGHLGITFTEIGEDYLKATMPVDAKTRQHFGILHGGASCVLSETLGSVCAWMCIDPDKQSAFGIEINANHTRSVTDGLVTGICKPVHVGRTLHVWNTEIYREDGKLSCISRLTVAVKDKRK